MKKKEYLAFKKEVNKRKVYAKKAYQNISPTCGKVGRQELRGCRDRCLLLLEVFIRDLNDSYKKDIYMGRGR